MNNQVEKASNKIQSEGKNIGANAKNAAESLLDSDYVSTVKGWIDDAPKSIEAATDKALEFVKARPLTVSLAFLGTGFVVGFFAGRRASSMTK